MLYFDTSFLVPLLLPEKTSEKIEAYFHHLPVDQTLVTSQWTRVEFASVLSRLVRMGELSKETAGLCNERFSLLLVLDKSNHKTLACRAPHREIAGKVRMMGNIFDSASENDWNLPE